MHEIKNFIKVFEFHFPFSIFKSLIHFQIAELRKDFANPYVIWIDCKIEFCTPDFIQYKPGKCNLLGAAWRFNNLNKLRSHDKLCLWETK